jgi:hypothetical protein
MNEPETTTVVAAMPRRRWPTWSPATPTKATPACWSPTSSATASDSTSTPVLTTEYQVKGEFADYGLRIDRELVAFIEVKRVATKLSTRHLRQVEMYAVNEGVEWIILTNGAVWQVYHITGGLPVVIDLALEVDLLGDEPPAHKVTSSST